jgi:hypothetical protein
MPSPGDHTGYRAETQGWAIRDLQEAGSGLLNLENDADGNLVVAAGTSITSESVAAPLTVRGAFKSGGPANAGEGIFFQVVSDNVDFHSTPSNKPIMQFDDWNGWIVLREGWPLIMRASSWLVQLVSANGATSYGYLSFTTAATQVADPTRVVLAAGSANWSLTTDGKLSPSIANVVAAEATDPSSTQALANSLRSVLIGLGILDAS